MNKKIILLLIVIVVFVYINCGRNQKELVVAFSSETYIIDPHLTNWATDIDVLGNVFEPIVKKRFDFRIEPALAYRWYNPEPKVWIFDLVEKVYFHNKKELTAEQIVKNFKRLKKIGIYSPYIFIINSIEKVTALEKYKVEFLLKKRIPDFLIRISDIKIIYVDDSTSSLIRDITKNKLRGTGPYKFSKIDKTSIILKRFDNYWGEQGKINKIKFVFKINFNKLISMINKPDIVDNLKTENMEKLKKDYDIKRNPSNFVYFLILNPKEKPLSDFNTREYIASIINKKTIVRDLKIPEDYIVNVLIPPWLKHYYNVEEHYSKHNFLPPRDKKEITIVYPKSDFINKKIAEYIYKALIKNGFPNIKIKKVTNKQWRYILFDNGVFSITPFRYATDTGGVDDLLIRFFHTRTKYHGVLNMFDYSNKALDRLIDDALKETEPDLRYEYFLKAHKMIVKENIFIPLFIMPDTLFIKKRIEIKGFTNIGNINSIKSLIKK